ncbi:MAG: lactate utilization protein [Paenibacillus sp.]|jgi:L-lactate dehydrogenase complex protein LldG|nr:lactate utilization protein [Paenibacillus sp.]
MSTNVGTIKGREAFIANISSRLGRKGPSAAAPEHPFRGAPDFYKEIERSTEEKIQLFTDNWTALTGKVLVVDAAEAREKIGAWLQEVAAELKVSQVARWEHDGLIGLGLDEALAASGIEVVPWKQAVAGHTAAGAAADGEAWLSAAEAGEAAAPAAAQLAPPGADAVQAAPHIPATAAQDTIERAADAADPSIAAAAAGASLPLDGAPSSGSNWAQRSELLQRTERCQMGIVWPDYAVANTSTLVLQCSPEHGRSVSLLTDILFAVFRADQLVTRMGEAFGSITAGKSDARQYPSSLNLITGPSRSADIENDLTIGIHGPGKVYAVIIK